jgi:RNA polymerase sigma factor for flagellar operon FliA
MKHEFFAGNITSKAQAPAFARDKLLAEYTPLVRRIAWHVHGRMSQTIDIEDLIQIGLMALIEAGRGFEDRGIDFKHYASVRVRGAMIDNLRREARMSRGNMANRRKLVATRKLLEDAQGHAASDEQMAREIGISLPEYHALVSATASERVESLDDVYSDHAMWFADQAESADTLVEKGQLMKELGANIRQLAEREALILQLYFVEEMNLEEIGATLGIGAARVCQIKKAALGKLRVKMSA